MAASFFFRNHFLMHSRFELLIPLSDSEKLNRLFNEMLLSIENLENKISRFIETSQTSILNKEASISPVKVDDNFFNLVEKCIQFNKRTFGCFDITAKKGSASGINAINTNSQEKTISFESEEVTIDFGAIGKGLALEIAIELINKSGTKDALINFGDSSIYGIGAHPNGNSWPVSISNGRNRIQVKLKNNGLSSSGLHDADSTKIAHILNPLSGELIRKDEKVVVVSNSPLLSEVLSTSIYAADEIARERIKKEFTDEEIFII